MLEKEEVDFYLEDLKSRFIGLDEKFGYDKYYLSYSGGLDSHFLYWFIKEYLKNDSIEVVGLNTYMEFPEIRERIYKYSDRVLLPKMKPKEIKNKFGIPCFSKEQDFFIYYYQNSRRKGKAPARTINEKIHGTYKNGHNISKKAQAFGQNEESHMVTHHCCTKLKKEPFEKFEKEFGKKAILGVRASESRLRKTQYTSCFSKNGKFSPLYDLTDEMLESIMFYYNIEKPEIYNSISRTGCVGCPYGTYKKDTQRELPLLNKAQLKFVVDYFKESYDILGVEYEELLNKKAD